jgi:hypothetical protein
MPDFSRQCPPTQHIPSPINPLNHGVFIITTNKAKGIKQQNTLNTEFSNGIVKSILYPYFHPGLTFGKNIHPQQMI